MEDIFKKFLYTGIGLAALTTEYVQKGIDDLVSNQKLSKEEGKKIIDDVVQKTASKKGEFEEQFKKMADEVMERFNFAKNKELEELKKRVAILEAKINKGKTAEAAVGARTFETAKSAHAPAAKKKVKKNTASQ